MPDPSTPWSAFLPELWERLLAIVFLDHDFDANEVGEDAGLSPAQIVALKAWCKHVEFEDEARRRAGAMAPSTLRFLESLKDDLSDEERALVDAEMEAIRAKAGSGLK